MADHADVTSSNPDPAPEEPTATAVSPSLSTGEETNQDSADDSQAQLAQAMAKIGRLEALVRSQEERIKEYETTVHRMETEVSAWERKCGELATSQKLSNANQSGGPSVLRPPQSTSTKRSTVHRDVQESSPREQSSHERGKEGGMIFLASPEFGSGSSNENECGRKSQTAQDQTQSRRELSWDPAAPEISFMRWCNAIQALVGTDDEGLFIPSTHDNRQTAQEVGEDQKNSAESPSVASEGGDRGEAEEKKEDKRSATSSPGTDIETESTITDYFNESSSSDEGPEGKEGAEGPAAGGPRPSASSRIAEAKSAKAVFHVAMASLRRRNRISGRHHEETVHRQSTDNTTATTAPAGENSTAVDVDDGDEETMMKNGGEGVEEEEKEQDQDAPRQVQVPAPVERWCKLTDVYSFVQQWCRLQAQTKVQQCVASPTHSDENSTGAGNSRPYWERLKASFAPCSTGCFSDSRQDFGSGKGGAQSMNAGLLAARMNLFDTKTPRLFDVSIGLCGGGATCIGNAGTRDGHVGASCSLLVPVEGQRLRLSWTHLVFSSTAQPPASSSFAAQGGSQQPDAEEGKSPLEPRASGCRVKCDWYRVELGSLDCSSPSSPPWRDEQLVLAAEDTTEYTVTDRDVGCYLVAVATPFMTTDQLAGTEFMTTDQLAGTEVGGCPVSIRTDRPCESSVPSAQNLQIAGDAVLGETLCAQYKFVGGTAAAAEGSGSGRTPQEEQGPSSICWYASVDGLYWTEIHRSEYPNVSFPVHAHVLHQYLRVQVVPVRAVDACMSKGTITISKSVYVNLSPAQDQLCIQAIATGRRSFDNVVFLDGNSTQQKGEGEGGRDTPIEGRLELSFAEMCFVASAARQISNELGGNDTTSTDGEPRRGEGGDPIVVRQRFDEPYPLLFQSPADPTEIICCDGRMVLDDKDLDRNATKKEEDADEKEAPGHVNPTTTADSPDDSTSQRRKDPEGAPRRYVFRVKDSSTADELLLIYRAYFCLRPDNAHALGKLFSPAEVKTLRNSPSCGGGDVDVGEGSSPKESAAEDLAAIFLKQSLRVKGSIEQLAPGRHSSLAAPHDPATDENELELLQRFDRPRSEFTSLGLLEGCLYNEQEVTNGTDDEQNTNTSNNKGSASSAPCRSTTTKKGNPRVLPFLLPLYPGVRF